MNNIILCGFKSCGKSTQGQKLAAELGYHFIDTDLLIAKNYRSFYLQEGPLAFREMEKRVIAALVEFQNCVIATGGGSVLDRENVAVFKKIGKIVYLCVEKSELKRRMIKEEIPAFLDPLAPEESFEKIYDERKALYEQIADLVIDPEKLSASSLPFLNWER